MVRLRTDHLLDARVAGWIGDTTAIKRAAPEFFFYVSVRTEIFTSAPSTEKSRSVVVIST